MGITEGGVVHDADGHAGIFQSNCNVINWNDGGTWVRRVSFLAFATDLVERVQPGVWIAAAIAFIVSVAVVYIRRRRASQIVMHEPLLGRSSMRALESMVCVSGVVLNCVRGRCCS